MVYFEKTDALIEYLQSRQLMEVTINGGDQHETDYKMILTKALAASKQFDVKGFVADISHKKEIKIDNGWMTTYLLPNIKEAGLNKLAFVVNDEYDRNEAGISARQLELNQKLETKFFLDKEKAYEWLETN